jgi:hypothetical protein
MTHRPRHTLRRLTGWRPTGHGVCQAGFVSATVLAFLLVNAQAAAAATGSGDGENGGMLAPFNVPSSEGVPLDHYQLVSDPGGVTDFQQEAQSYLMGMCFALVRIVVGLECWLIHWAYSFPVTKMMAAKSQALADGYRSWVVDQLGLPGMLLAWAVVVCSVMLLRGRTGRAAGELALSFVIVGVASAGLLRPDVLLGTGGLLEQARQASLEVASITTNQGAPPPSSVDPASISGPLEQTLTSTFVVQPYQLLQFGRPIPKDDKAYDTYLASVAMNGGPTGSGTPAEPHACDGLEGMAAQACQLGQTGNPAPPSCDALTGGTKSWCLQDTGKCDQLSGATKQLCDMGASQSTAGSGGEANCDKLTGLAKHFCQAAPPTSGSTTDQAKALADRFKDVDPAISAYIAPPSWDRVFGAMLLLFAALVVLVMVVAMVLALFAAQAADALLAALDYPALVWAILPGPNRGVLWRWIGSFVTSILVLFAASIFLPVFGLTCSAFLSDSGQDLITRMFLVDAVAVVALGFHRRIMAGASTAGSRLANRMRWARIGGSGTGDDATRTGQVIAGALARGAGGGMAAGHSMFAGSSPMQAHLARRARVLSSARALADIPGAPLHPGRLLGDIGREAAHGLAPVTLAARGVHHAWKGRALTPEEFEARRIRPGLGGKLPVGSQLHNRLIQTRGGRVLLGGSRLAWGASFGAPATWTRTRRRVAAAQGEVRGQVAHYQLEASNYWRTEWKPGFDDMTTPARVAGKAAAQTGARLHVAADVYGHAAVDATKRAAVSTTTAAVLRAGTTSAATRPGSVRAERSHSRVASEEEQARAEILHALRRAQREARGESGGDGS